MTCGISAAPPPTLTHVRITNGSISRIRNWPWVAALVEATTTEIQEPVVRKPYCGGAVISNKYILTAGHCAIGYAISKQVYPYC